MQKKIKIRQKNNSFFNRNRFNFLIIFLIVILFNLTKKSCSAQSIELANVSICLQITDQGDLGKGYNLSWHNLLTKDTALITNSYTLFSVYNKYLDLAEDCINKNINLYIAIDNIINLKKELLNIEQIEKCWFFTLKILLDKEFNIYLIKDYENKFIDSKSKEFSELKDVSQLFVIIPKNKTIGYFGLNENLLEKITFDKIAGFFNIDQKKERENFLIKYTQIQNQSKLCRNYDYEYYSCLIKNQLIALFSKNYLGNKKRNIIWLGHGDKLINNSSNYYFLVGTLRSDFFEQFLEYLNKENQTLSFLIVSCFGGDALVDICKNRDRCKGYWKLKYNLISASFSGECNSGECFLDTKKTVGDTNLEQMSSYKNFYNYIKSLPIQNKSKKEKEKYFYYQSNLYGFLKSFFVDFCYYDLINSKKKSLKILKDNYKKDREFKIKVFERFLKKQIYYKSPCALGYTRGILGVIPQIRLAGEEDFQILNWLDNCIDLNDKNIIKNFDKKFYNNADKDLLDLSIYNCILLSSHVLNKKLRIGRDSSFILSAKSSVGVHMIENVETELSLVNFLKRFSFFLYEKLENGEFNEEFYFCMNDECKLYWIKNLITVEDVDTNMHEHFENLIIMIPKKQKEMDAIFWNKQDKKFYFLNIYRKNKEVCLNFLNDFLISNCVIFVENFLKTLEKDLLRCSFKKNEQSALCIINQIRTVIKSNKISNDIIETNN